MSERKVLNKYYPPDFDPSKIPRLRLPKTRQYTVRIMTPCNMRCNTCGDYISKAKKFNARKETVESEGYLGLKIFRFYFKCPKCMAEITFKTDPKNCDYELEHGATRNFQALRLAEQQAEREAKEKEEEEKLNPMKMLENRTKASRREMEELEALEELRDINQRKVVVNYEEIIERGKKEAEEALKRQEEEDEALVRSIFKKENGPVSESSSDEDEPTIPKLGVSFFKNKSEPATSTMAASESNETSLKRKLSSLIKVKKQCTEKDKVADDVQSKDAPPPPPPPVPTPSTSTSFKPTSAIAALSQYSDSNSDSE